MFQGNAGLPRGAQTGLLRLPRRGEETEIQMAEGATVARRKQGESGVGGCGAELNNQLPVATLPLPGGEMAGKYENNMELTT